MFTDFRERGRRTEKETSMWTKNTNQLPPVRILTGDQTHNVFGVWDNAPTNWATWSVLAQHFHCTAFYTKQRLELRLPNCWCSSHYITQHNKWHPGRNHLCNFFFSISTKCMQIYMLSQQMSMNIQVSALTSSSEVCSISLVLHNSQVKTPLFHLKNVHKSKQYNFVGVWTQKQRLPIKTQNKSFIC